MKICSKCGLEKEYSEFGKSKESKDGYKYSCKECRKIEYNEYYKNNKDKISEKAKCSPKTKQYQKEYRENNKDRLCEYKRTWYQDNKEVVLQKEKEKRELNPEYMESYRKNNKERTKEYNKQYGKEYYRDNKEDILQKQKEYRKTRIKNDDKFRFVANLRRRILHAFNFYSKNGKTQSCKEYGIDFEAIYNHIGPKPDGDYHLDHIIPLCKFDLDNPEHVRLAHLPQNLQWLPADDNLSKNDSVDMEIIGCSLVLLSIAKKIGLI